MAKSGDTKVKSPKDQETGLEARVKKLERLTNAIDGYAYENFLWAEKLRAWAVMVHEKIEMRKSDPPPPPPNWPKPKSGPK